MVINCLEINQVINELLIAFQDCNKIKNSDLRRLDYRISNGYTLCLSIITYI